MKDVLKILIVLILLIPALLLTCLIWLFGGWTQSPYMKPNPMDSLFNWLSN